MTHFNAVKHVFAIAQSKLNSVFCSGNGDL